MFDVGISEILVIAVVALVVIGPERLPRVARTVGTLLGRAQRYVADVKAEVNREMELEELRKMQTQIQDAARSIHQEVSSAGQEMQTAVSDAEKELNKTLAAATATETATGADSAASIPLTEITPLSEPPGTPAQPEVIVTAESGTDGNGSPMATATPGQATALPAHGNETTVASSTASVAPAPDAPQQSTLFPEHTIR